MHWLDIEDIALALYETYPTQDPLQLRFTELHEKICALPDFADNPDASNEKILEAIQMQWLDEYQD